MVSYILILSEISKTHIIGMAETFRPNQWAKLQKISTHSLCPDDSDNSNDSEDSDHSEDSEDSDNSDISDAVSDKVI